MFIFLLLPLLAFAASRNSNLIDWNPDYKLVWEDFRARPNPASPNAALTATELRFDIKYNSEKGYQYHITCQFNKNKSWGRVRTDYILSHEQGHFDIAEIYARRLCKAFREYKPDSNPQAANKEISGIYQNIMQQMDQRQKDYDAETQNSIIKEKQAEWLKKIAEELKSLQSYADYR
jgi:hypothetical protein